MRAAIIGYGEIGSAVAAVYRRKALPEPIIVDPAIGRTATLDDAEVVHVCVPAKAVSDVVQGGPGRLWIVHSTVPVGTCRALAWRCSQHLVHAPVRGIHPHLVDGLLTFTMPVGGTRTAQARAVAHLASLGIRAQAFGSWETTELAKILCTTRLGVDVLFMRHVADLCDQHGVSFDLVYTAWTHQYNHGFDVLGLGDFHRPVLAAKPGPIGGHCVRPNAAMLAQQSAWARMVVEEGAKDWTRQIRAKQS